MDTNLFVHWLVDELSDPATTLSILPHHCDGRSTATSLDQQVI
jgi:hypothetical protein